MRHLISFLVFAFCVHSQAENIFQSMSIGASFGGSIDVMISDQQTQAYGLGLGTNWGFYTVTNRKSELNYKLTLESLALREEALANAKTDYLLSGTQLKSLGQNWFLIAPGIEYRLEKENYQLFYEAFLGYAIGCTSRNYVKSTIVDSSVTEIDGTTKSTFVLGGGFGFKKHYQNRLSIFTSIRTFFLFTSPYSDAAFSGKALFGLPLIFNLGAEYQL